MGVSARGAKIFPLQREKEKGKNAFQAPLEGRVEINRGDTKVCKPHNRWQGTGLKGDFTDPK